MRVQELILVITAREQSQVALGNMACQKGMFPVFSPDARHTPLHLLFSHVFFTV